MDIDVVEFEQTFTSGSTRAVSQTATLTLPLVSFVIPTLNEAKNLPLVLPRIPKWAFEVIIVDGRSTDNTIEVAQQLRPDVRIVTEARRGKGAALQSGFRAARGEIIIMLDADGSMAPEEAIAFVGALMAGADLVKGSRAIQGAGSIDISWFRSMGNWGLTLIVRLLYWCSFSDLCYGYIAFWSKHVDRLGCDCDGFEIETLINVRALKNKLKISEVASLEAPRIHGVSKLHAISDGIRIFKTILRERLSRYLPVAEPIDLQMAEPIGELGKEAPRGNVTETGFERVARQGRLPAWISSPPPTSLPAADHPARDLALSPVHTELPGRGGATGG
jgi:glycosyltransferase involved in cell wall biosynthesis